MESETHNFLKAEKMADELVETLTKLKTEVESYDSASKQLDEIRSDLSRFLQVTSKIVEDSHESLEVLKSIGGPEINRLLLELEKKSLKLEEHQKSNNIKQMVFNIIILLMIITNGVILFLMR